jgi:hypothetical protein
VPGLTGPMCVNTGPQRRPRRQHPPWPRHSPRRGAEALLLWPACRLADRQTSENHCASITDKSLLVTQNDPFFGELIDSPSLRPGQPLWTSALGVLTGRGFHVGAVVGSQPLTSATRGHQRTSIGNRNGLYHRVITD